MIDLQACLDYQKRVSKDRTSTTVDLDLASLGVDLALLAQARELPEDLETALQLLVHDREEEKAEIAQLRQDLESRSAIAGKVIDQVVEVRMERDELQSKLDTIVMPLGWEAGQPLNLADALSGMAIEMLAHRSDLLTLASDHRRPDLERAGYSQRAADLEKYATALNSVALQLRPERWKPENFAGLLELARQNSVTLPGWMTEGE